MLSVERDRFNLKHAMIEEAQEVEVTWRRVFARIFDYLLINFILVGGFILFTVSVENKLRLGESLFSTAVMFIAFLIATGLMATFVWVFVEAALLANFKTTPGKALLGIKLKGQSNEFSYWLSRSFYVWYYGLACGFPILNILAMFNAYMRLINNKVTWWDKRLDVELIVEKNSQQVAFYVILILPLIAGQGVIARSFVSEFITPLLKQTFKFDSGAKKKSSFKIKLPKNMGKS